jgi:hypothetical protein
MSQQRPKNNSGKSLGFGDLARAALGLPARYAAGSSLVIKIEPEQSMSNPFQIALSKTPLMPSLFQAAASAGDTHSELAAKSPFPGHARLAERMLNPRKLEAVLKALGKKKKHTER